MNAQLIFAMCAILFIFVACLAVGNSYRILVIFPTGSYSHQRPQQAISQGLAAAGHHVTIISPNTFPTTNPNITQIDVRFTYDYMKVFDLSASIGPWGMHALETIHRTNVADGVLNHPPVTELLKSGQQFDGIVMESLLHVPLFMAKEIFNATLIGFTTLEMFPLLHSSMGNVIHPVLHPFFIYHTPKRIGFFDRIVMCYFDLYHRYWHHFEFLPSLDRIIKKNFPGTKTTAWDLMKSFDFTIEGMSPVLGNVRPMVPNTIQVGFLHIAPPKPLPENLQNYLDRSKNGVIYLSFGSNVKSSELKPEIKNTIIKVLRDLPYDILWKFETPSMPDKPSNVRIEKWLPQQDILAHKNIKLFIMQGGLQSMEETIDRGIPVVVIPFFGDQAANAEKIEDLGIGKKLNLEDLSYNSLKSCISEVIENPKYKQTVKQLGDRIRDTPMTPVQTAVWWIEYAIRNRGAEHLKYKGTDVPFIEYYLIDVIAVHLVGIFLVLYVLKKLFNMIRGGNSKTTKKMKKQ
ncbi:UDP-glycosyltransferase UGT5-like isoform X2 [Culicoides brevitarsis]|uniref:UDP-glycosyltransferase UGT5-like isoform X2 n=1 Tax=Culicoides brevitarsis TaxID=469753 RepID=UPI00307B2DBA